MFQPFDDWPPPPRWEPPRPERPQVTRRQERVLIGLVGVNLVLLFLAPLAGSSVVHLAVALLR